MSRELDDLNGHTDRDYDELIAAGVDPYDTQPREHSVQCWCGVRTMHQSGGCDTHYIEPRAARDANRRRKLDDALAAHPANGVAK